MQIASVVIQSPLIAIGCICAITFPADQWQATAGLLLIYSALSGTLAYHRFRLLQADMVPDLLTFFCFVQFTLKLSNLIFILIVNGVFGSGGVYTIAAAYDQEPYQYQFKGELLLLLGFCIFAGIWLLISKKQPPGLLVKISSTELWRGYVLSVAIIYLLKLTETTALFGNIYALLWLAAICLVTCLLSGESPYQLGGRLSHYSFLALLPLYGIAATTGMKSEIVNVSYAFLLPLLRGLQWARLKFIALFALIFILIVVPFNQVWRDLNWYQGWSASAFDVAAEVIDQYAEQDTADNIASSSLVSWIARSSTSSEAGLVVSIAEQTGNIGPILLENFWSIFIPRWLWPEKPVYQPGAWFTWYLGQARLVGEATSARAMFLPLELNWMFGFGGVLVGMVGVSLLYAAVYSYMQKRSTYSTPYLFGSLALTLSSATLITGHTIYMISAPIIHFFYIYSLDKILILYRNKSVKI